MSVSVTGVNSVCTHPACLRHTPYFILVSYCGTGWDHSNTDSYLVLDHSSLLTARVRHRCFTDRLKFSFATALLWPACISRSLLCEILHLHPTQATLDFHVCWGNDFGRGLGRLLAKCAKFDQLEVQVYLIHILAALTMLCICLLPEVQRVMSPKLAASVGIVHVRLWVCRLLLTTFIE